jgi:hypothetical protein
VAPYPPNRRPQRWPDDAATANEESNSAFHYPDWSKEMLELLYADPRVAASSHETTDADPELQTTKNNYSLESHILGLNRAYVAAAAAANAGKLSLRSISLNCGVCRIGWSRSGTIETADRCDLNVQACVSMLAAASVALRIMVRIVSRGVARGRLVPAQVLRTACS